MLEAINPEKISQLNADILKGSGVDVRECYQCGKCSAGCSVNWLMDYKPNVLMHLAQMGQRQKIITSTAIWLCTGCCICSARCPRDLDIALVIDALRQLAVTEGVKMGEHDIPTFHQYFLKEIKQHGRIHEFPLVANFKLHSEHPFSDFALGPLMLAKGKLKLDSSLGKGVEDLKELFDLKV